MTLFTHVLDNLVLQKSVKDAYWQGEKWGLEVEKAKYVGFRVYYLCVSDLDSAFAGVDYYGLCP